MQINILPNSLISSVKTPGSLSMRHQFPALSAIFLNSYDYLGSVAVVIHGSGNLHTLMSIQRHSTQIGILTVHWSVLELLRNGNKGQKLMFGNGQCHY